jgi:hypothetical protein
MQQDYAQANIDAAHSLEERFLRDWPQLWADGGLFRTVKTGFTQQLADAIDIERPFACTRCGKGLTFNEMIYSGASEDKSILETILCYPCKQRVEAKGVIANFAHGRVGGPSTAEQAQLDDAAARLEESIA